MNAKNPQISSILHNGEMVRSCVLAIAGSDSSGLAGIQRDNHTIHTMGCHAINVITANTAQNQHGVQAIHPVDDIIFTEQLNVNAQRKISAIKIGLIPSASMAENLLAFLQTRDAPIVLDPVLAASSGDALYSENESHDRLIALRKLLPMCDVITPNIDEAEKLAESEIHDDGDIIRTARLLQSLGAANVVIKGGHANTDESKDEHSAAQVRDFVLIGDHAFWLTSPRQDCRNSRGTGCTFASIIASALAQDYSLADACVLAKMGINQGLAHAYRLLEQSGPVNLLSFPAQQQFLPALDKIISNTGQQKTSTIKSPSPTLPNGEDVPLGLYPVVESAKWLERLLPFGVSTIQLRIKNLSGEALANEIKSAISLAQQYNCRLFINDHWALAIELGAYGVHLGQEDLDSADINAIKTAGLRLGISTHCHYEAARAHFYQPSYIACGPIYPTTSKQMPWIPHGATGLAYWRATLDYPLVAIGGINIARLPEVLAQKPDGIAMITAITEAPNPEEATKTLLAMINNAAQS